MLQRRLFFAVILISACLMGSAFQAEAQQATLKADFNGSGAVDFDDFFLFAEAFGARQGEAKFNAKFDLSGNGAVDFDDFFLFAVDFGKKAGQTGGGGTREVSVYIADLLGDRVQIINAKDNLSLGTIPVGQPRGLAFSPDGNVLYVAGVDSFYAFRSDNKQDFALPMDTAFKVAVSPDGQRAYVTQEGIPELGVKGGLAVVDLRTKKLSRLIPLPGRPSGIVLTPDGKKAYVANRTTRMLVMDLTREVLKDSLLTTNAAPSRVALSTDGGRAYLNNGVSDTINVVDTGISGGVEAKERIVQTFATKTGETHLISTIQDLNVSADGKLIYASSFRVILAVTPGSSTPSPTLIGELLVIDAATGRADRILLGENVATLGIAPDGKTAYAVFARGVAESLEVGIVDLQTRKGIGSLPIDFQQPVEIKFRTVIR